MESVSQTERVTGYDLHDALRHEDDGERIKPGTSAEASDVFASRAKIDEWNRNQNLSVQQSVYTGKGSFFDTVI